MRFLWPKWAEKNAEFEKNVLLLDDANMSNVGAPLQGDVRIFSSSILPRKDNAG